MNRAVRYPITTSVTAAQNWLEIEPKSAPWIAAEVSLPQPALALKVERHGRGVSPPASWQFGFGKVGRPVWPARRGGGHVSGSERIDRMDCMCLPSRGGWDDYAWISECVKSAGQFGSRRGRASRQTLPPEVIGSTRRRRRRKTKPPEDQSSRLGPYSNSRRCGSKGGSSSSGAGSARPRWR